MISNDYDTPVMYQDLGAYSMNPFGIDGMMGMPYANTSYLGGVTLKPQPCQDQVNLINKKDKEGENTMKKAAYALGALFLIGFIPYFRKNIKNAGGLTNYAKNIYNNITNKIKNIF